MPEEEVSDGSEDSDDGDHDASVETLFAVTKGQSAGVPANILIWFCITVVLIFLKKLWLKRWQYF